MALNLEDLRTGVGEAITGVPQGSTTGSVGLGLGATAAPPPDQGPTTLQKVGRVIGAIGDTASNAAVGLQGGRPLMTREILAQEEALQSQRIENLNNSLSTLGQASKLIRRVPAGAQRDQLLNDFSQQFEGVLPGAGAILRSQVTRPNSFPQSIEEAAALDPIVGAHLDLVRSGDADLSDVIKTLTSRADKITEAKERRVAEQLSPLLEEGKEEYARLFGQKRLDELEKNGITNDELRSIFEQVDVDDQFSPAARDFVFRRRDLLESALPIPDKEREKILLRHQLDVAKSFATGVDVQDAVLEDGTVGTVLVYPNGRITDQDGNPVKIQRKLGVGQERGEPGAFGGKLTPEQRKVKNEIESSEVMNRQFVARASEVIQLVEENPAATLASGNIGGILNTVTANARSLTDSAGFRYGTTEGGKFVQKFDSADAFLADFESRLASGELEAANNALQEIAGANAEFRSALIELAFMQGAAQGQQGRSVSDKDVDRFLTQLGAGQNRLLGQDPEVFSRVLSKVVENSARNFEILWKVRTKNTPLPGVDPKNPPNVLEGTRFDKERPAVATDEAKSLTRQDIVRMNESEVRQLIRSGGEKLSEEAMAALVERAEQLGL